MPARTLKLGTRRSALARAQSAAVARALEQLHPGICVELVGIDTRGDRILDQPLSTVEGKEFFTAEIDAALLAGRVDMTVHSCKDLSLERRAEFVLAAVPRREEARDIVWFAPDVAERLADGHELLIGSSSPRRASLLPQFLTSVLPWRADGGGAAQPAKVRLVDLRGNVDSRLRRLLEPRGSARHLDGVVLAFAGLARLWADDSERPHMRQLLSALPRIVVPLCSVPGAPAQGALAIECRTDDAPTRALLSALEHAPTRAAIGTERRLLAERGGGCHQRFGATQVVSAEMGSLLYMREANEVAGVVTPAPPQLHWQPPEPLPARPDGVHAWDGSQVSRGPIEPIAAGVLRAEQLLQQAPALFVAHRRALPAAAAPVPVAAGAPHLWVPGLETWRALAQRGFWVEGCAEGLGFSALLPLLRQPVLQLPPQGQWAVLTHAQADWDLDGKDAVGEVVATYQHTSTVPADIDERLRQATHIYWNSAAQFDRWGGQAAPSAQHACGAGKTYAHLQRVGVKHLRRFPQAALWRQWLGLAAAGPHT